MSKTLKLNVILLCQN